MSSIETAKAISDPSVLGSAVIQGYLQDFIAVPRAECRWLSAGGIH